MDSCHWTLRDPEGGLQGSGAEGKQESERQLHPPLSAHPWLPRVREAHLLLKRSSVHLWVWAWQVGWTSPSSRHGRTVTHGLGLQTTHWQNAQIVAKSIFESQFLFMPSSFPIGKYTFNPTPKSTLASLPAPVHRHVDFLWTHLPAFLSRRPHLPVCSGSHNSPLMDAWGSSRISGCTITYVLIPSLLDS